MFPQIQGVRQVSNATVEVISRLYGSTLKSLELAEAVITDDALCLLAQHCQNIEQLSLRRCFSISDMGLAALARGCSAIQNLEYVFTLPLF